MVHEALVNRTLVDHVNAAIASLSDEPTLTANQVADVAIPGARAIVPDTSDADLRDMIALIVRRKFDPASFMN
jgi:hypothetical protein